MNENDVSWRSGEYTEVAERRFRGQVGVWGGVTMQRRAEMLSYFWSFLLSLFSVLWFKLEYKQVKTWAKHTPSITTCLQCRYEIFQTHFSTLLLLNNPSTHSCSSLDVFALCLYFRGGRWWIDQAESKQSNAGLLLFFFPLLQWKNIYICKSTQPRLFGCPSSVSQSAKDTGSY